MRKVSLLAALTLAATLLAASPILAATIPQGKHAVRSGEITPAQACQQIAAHNQEQNQQAIDVQACQQMVASASASATALVQEQDPASPEFTGRGKTLPDTGGTPLVSLAAGVLLMGGGLLLRRISR